MDGSSLSQLSCLTSLLMVFATLSLNSSHLIPRIFRYFKLASYTHLVLQATDATTALIGSLLIGVYLLVGPIVGGLVNKLGARKVVIIGSFIGGLGILLSVFAPNIGVFMLLYGVVGGIGFGFIYLPAIVVVGFYFESKR